MDTTKKKAKLFRHGGSQAVRLPKEFRFEGSEVAIRRDGDRVILEPVATDWSALLAEIDRLPGGIRFELPDDPPPEDPPSFD
ncbi:MAG TPA: type II toxin-antitoxin system VapB family antitoxin [Caulobacteraceae bacterium]